MPPVLPGRLPRMRERCTAMCNVATCAQAFAPLSALPLRTDRTGAVSCRSGVRAAACAMDMAGAQSMLLAAAKVAAEAAEDAEEVVEEVASRGAPAISIVGKTVGGRIDHQLVVSTGDGVVRYQTLGKLDVRCGL